MSQFGRSSFRLDSFHTRKASVKMIGSRFKYILFVQGCLLTAMVCAENLYCNPRKNCEAVGSGRRVVDPKDCHNYYVCITDNKGNVIPSDEPYSCDEGYYFSSSSCYYGSICEDPECVNVCPTDCTTYSYETISDPYDCSKFYTCDPNHDIQVKYCPGNAPYFDGVGCSVDEYECCNSCTPYCEELYKETKDPYDCRRYYVCLRVGIPSEEDHFECGSGKYFDPLVGSCQTENGFKHCSPVCKNLTDSYVSKPSLKPGPVPLIETENGNISKN